MMNYGLYQKQISRLAEAFGDKHMTSEKARVLWESIKTMSDQWFSETVTKFIANSRYSPLPLDFIEEMELYKKNNYMRMHLPNSAAEIHPSKNSIFSKEDIAEMFNVMRKRSL